MVNNETFHIYCPKCGCNKLQDDTNNHKTCLNVLCDWKGLITPDENRRDCITCGKTITQNTTPPTCCENCSNKYFSMDQKPND